MKINRRGLNQASAVLFLIVGLTTISVRLKADTGTCGGQILTLPFTDVAASNIFFCSIAEAFFTGLTNGTSPTTYNPADPVPREQMAAFITRTLDQSLKRGNRRAALNQFWTSTSTDGLGLTTVGQAPQLDVSDGADVWVANFTSNSVSRVRASDGKLIENWTGATGVTGIVAAKGLIFATGHTSPGRLYQIDPTQAAGAITTLSSTLPNLPGPLSFDGTRIWIANASGSVSIVTLNPFGVTNATGFSVPAGICFDGANMWVTDFGTDSLYKLGSNGAIIQTIPVGADPWFPIFDGTNIWVPNSGASSVSIVRASTGGVLATLTGNGLNFPIAASFDGQRILVTNLSGNSVSLWKATDLTPLGSFSTGPSTTPFGVCSDGINFWIVLSATDQLARF
jgi:hypothetical protein